MRKSLPEAGRKPEEILEDLKAFGKDDPDYKQGRVWSLVYYLDEELDKFLAAAYRSFSSANGLNPTAFKSLKKFENDIIDTTANLHHATPDVCGVVTSGGTESCLLAVKTCRDLARAEKGIRKPEMIIPTTAHVAWFKASEYFGVKIRLLPLDKDCRADVSKLEKMITKNTVMILGGAPAYPHGVVDPIEEMGAIAQKHNIPLHVDACVGGFILPFMEMNGVDVPKWDWRVPGVTSISADLHKYGFASKGASTITWRNLDMMKYQMFVQQDWPGGVFASPALLGTRPGGAYAAAWAALQYFGSDGYRKLAADTQQAFDMLHEAVTTMPELKVLGNPTGPLLGYGSSDPDVNIFAVGDQMENRGWQVNRLQNPNGLHAMITARHLDCMAEYISDLKDCVAIVKANPALAGEGNAATYGMIATVPLRGMVKKKVLDMFAGMYAPGGGDIDLSGQGMDGDESGTSAGKPALLDRLVLAYAQWKQKRA